jgi:SWI/SNF-related matrix-associated actin-dependent regulator of chromatin subfamily A3
MLLEALCLRRTKEIINLPGLKQHLRTLEFSTAEREQYEKTKKILMRTIRQRVGEVEKSSKFGLFQANLQMRILCNHGTFQKPFSWHRRSYQDEREAVVCALGHNGEITCSGCQQPMPILGSSRLGNGFQEQCAHVLCSECIEESSTPDAGAQIQHCPVCVRWRTQGRIEGGVDAVGNAAGDAPMPGVAAKSTIEDDDNRYFNAEGHSTKMRALIEDISKDLWTTKRHAPSFK